jgi:t-SNARE complex subunit (syntaxin)
MGDLEQAVARHDEQIKTLFKNQECLTELTKSVARLVEKMDNVEKGQEKVERAVEDLRGADGKKWNTVRTAVITGVVGALIGAGMALLF